MNKEASKRISNYIKAFGIEVERKQGKTVFTYENEYLDVRSKSNTPLDLFTKRQKRALFSVDGKESDASDASFTFQISNCVVFVSQIDIPSDDSEDLDFAVDFDRGSQISKYYNLIISSDELGSIHIDLRESRFVIDYRVIPVGVPHLSASEYLEDMMSKVDKCKGVGDTLEKNVLKAMLSDPVIIQILNERIMRMSETLEDAKSDDNQGKAYK